MFHVRYLTFLCLYRVMTTVILFHTTAPSVHVVRVSRLMLIFKALDYLILIEKSAYLFIFLVFSFFFL